MKLNKKQKRTATIVSMAALLAVVLGMGGQTFAKYISTDKATAQATVAKWGLVVNVNAASMVPGGVVNTTTDGNGVKADAYSGKVAPGQGGSISLVFSGSAEVDATVSFTFNDWKEVKLSNGSDVNYYPIAWTLTDNGSPVSVTDSDSDGRTSLAEVKAHFTTFASSNATITKGTTFNHNFVLSWTWAPEANNKYDTYLGNIAAGDLDTSTFGDDVSLATFKTNSVTDLYVNFDVEISQKL